MLIHLSRPMNPTLFGMAQRDSPVRNADLFISFRETDGTWGEAIKMDSLNTENAEYGLRVTPDGKYLFFNRNMGTPDNTDIFWVDPKLLSSIALRRTSTNPCVR